MTVLLLSSIAAAGELYALLLNGGSSPRGNYQSHLDHLQQMREVLVTRGIPAAHISVFSADGDDPTPDLVTQVPAEDDWLLTRSHAAWLLNPETVNSAWPEVTLRPATRDALSTWFAEDAAALHPGDTLFVYTTDHGTEAGLDLWNEDELSPKELRAWLDAIPVGVRVVVVMSQCHSGTFYDALTPSRPDECAFYAVPRDRKAYGCYAGTSEERIGHGFAFIDALGAAATVGAAHDAVWLDDQSPDVPLRSSDLFLAELVARQARRDRISQSTWINRAFTDTPLSPEELAPLRALSERYGVPLSQDLRVLEGTTYLTLRAQADLEAANERWTDLLGRLNDRLLDRIEDLEVEPRDRARLTHRLRDSATADGTLGLATAVRDRAEGSSAAWWRSLTREAVNERLRNALVALAGVRAATSDADRARLDALRTCEATELGHPVAAPPATPPEAWPTLQVDTSLPHTPATIGVRFDPRKTYLQVTGVDLGQPADVAGVRVGDIVRAIDGVDVDRVTAGAWFALAPTDHPLRVRITRGTETQELLVQPRVRAP